jgi:hypothetical protein
MRPAINPESTVTAGNNLTRHRVGQDHEGSKLSHLGGQLDPAAAWSSRCRWPR